MRSEPGDSRVRCDNTIAPKQGNHGSGRKKNTERDEWRREFSLRGARSHPRDRIDDAKETDRAEQCAEKYRYQCSIGSDRRSNHCHQRDIAESHRFLLESDLANPSCYRDSSGPDARAEYGFIWPDEGLG